MKNSLLILTALSFLFFNGAQTYASDNHAENPKHNASNTHKNTGHKKAHADGHDSHGHHDPINWTSMDYKPSPAQPKPAWKNPPLIFAFINFGILVFLLVYFVRKPLGSFLQERHESIKIALSEAKELRAQAATRLQEMELKLAKLDDEIASIKESVKEDAAQEKKKIIEQAKDDATALVESADRTLNLEVERAKRKLEVMAIEAALAAAEKILKNEVSAQDVARLRGEYFEQIEQIGGGN